MREVVLCSVLSFVKKFCEVFVEGFELLNCVIIIKLV